MADTTMFEMVDALVALISGLPACAPANGVFVSDGFPMDTSANVVVAVGGTTNPTATLTSATVTVGGQAVKEEYEIEGTVSAWNGGTNQQEVRNNAKTVYTAIQAAVRAQVAPGGAGFSLATGQLVFAEMVVADLKQTDENSRQDGREAVVTFRVMCTARI